MGIIFGTIAVVLIIDALFVLAFPDWSLKFVKRLGKGGANGLRKVGFWELAIGIVILLAALFL